MANNDKPTKPKCDGELTAVGAPGALVAHAAAESQISTFENEAKEPEAFASLSRMNTKRLKAPVKKSPTLIE